MTHDEMAKVLYQSMRKHARHKEIDTNTGFLDPALTFSEYLSVELHIDPSLAEAVTAWYITQMVKRLDPLGNAEDYEIMKQDEPKTPYEAWRQTPFQRYGLSDEALPYVSLTSAEARAMILRTVREEDRAEVERLFDALTTQKDDDMTNRHADEHPDVLDEAIELYAQETEEAGAVFQQPAHNDSTVCALEGKTYVMLANVNGILAVYEVDTAYRLHRLQSWPEALGDAF